MEPSISLNNLPTQFIGVLELFNLLYPFDYPFNPYVATNHPIPTLRAVRGRRGLPPLAHGGGEVLEHGDGGVPVDAGVGDADALLESGGALGGDLLVTSVDVGLEHDTDDGGLAGAQLLGDGGGDLGLVVVVLEGVAWSEEGGKSR